MDVESTIGEIEQLQEMFEAPDIRPLSASDISAANRRHDEMLAHSRGLGFGSISASAAEPSPQCFDRAKRRAKTPRGCAEPNRDPDFPRTRMN
jgi:hypothetical protein